MEKKPLVVCTHKFSATSCGSPTNHQINSLTATLAKSSVFSISQITHFHIFYNFLKGVDFPSWAAAERRGGFTALQSTFPMLVQSASLRDTELWGQWAKSPKCEVYKPMKCKKKNLTFYFEFLLTIFCRLNLTLRSHPGYPLSRNYC